MSQKRQTFWIDLVLLVIWMAFIWLHSLANGDDSLQESSFFVGLLRPIFSALHIEDPHAQSFFVRKSAHFLEYLVLGVLASRATRPHRVLSVLALIIIVLATPCIDESIQLLTPGREGRLFDVLLDISGALVGIVLFTLVHVVLAANKRPRYNPKHLSSRD